MSKQAVGSKGHDGEGAKHTLRYRVHGATVLTVEHLTAREVVRVLRQSLAEFGTLTLEAITPE